MDATRRRLLLAAPLTLTGCSMVENMFFYPDTAQYTRPEQFNLRHEDVFFNAPDGSRLHGWWLPARRQPALGNVLHLHGNASNISNHLPLAAWLPVAGFNLLMFDYRGFGRSEGRPTLAGIVDDGLAALQALRARAEVDPARLAVFGQSLGGATALRLLARDAQGVRGALIDSAFSSYRRIAREAATSSVVLAPFLPLALPMLPPAADDPLAALARIALPMYYLHGTADTVVPFAHSQALYEASRGERHLLPLDGGVHLEALTREQPRRLALAQLQRWMA